jgi:hypothetical protein
VTAADVLARDLICHIAAPLVQAARTQPARVAVLPLRGLSRAELEAVAVILAGMVDHRVDPFAALRWLTDKTQPDRCDEDTDAPPLRIGRP